MRKKSLKNKITQKITIKNSIIVVNESVDVGNNKELQKCYKKLYVKMQYIKLSQYGAKA